jgi:hypothetical protein
MTTTEIAKAVFLQAAHQIGNRDYAAHARANGYTIRNPIGREVTAESIVLFNETYAATFGMGDRTAMTVGLESAGA